MITNVYIDGFNLYYRALKDTPFRWLDLHKLAETLFPEDTINRVCYFTARRLLVGDDEAEAFVPVPLFWSDQYGRKIQMAGSIGPDDDMSIATGSLAERRFAVIYGRAGRLVGVLGFNRPRHVMRYRMLIESDTSFEDAIAADF